MSEPPPHAPTFNPDDHGLYKRLISDGAINHGAWMRTVSERGFVGTCRSCGGLLKPRAPERVNDLRTDYEAECVDCRQTLVAPNGATVRGSGRLKERRR